MQPGFVTNPAALILLWPSKVPIPAVILAWNKQLPSEGAEACCVVKALIVGCVFPPASPQHPEQGRTQGIKGTEWPHGAMSAEHFISRAFTPFSWLELMEWKQNACPGSPQGAPPRCAGAWGQPSGPAAGRAEEQPLLAGPAAPEAPRRREGKRGGTGQGRPRPPPQPAGLPSAAKGSPGVSLRESPPVAR